MPSAPSIGRGLPSQQRRTKGGPCPATRACWVQQHVWSLSRTAAGVAECAHGLSGRCTQAHTFSSTVQPATLLLQPHAWPRGWAPSFVQYTAGVLTRSGHRRTQLSVAGGGRMTYCMQLVRRRMTYILQCCFVVAFAGLAAEIAAHQLNTRDSNSGGGCKRILGGEAQAALTLQTWQAFGVALGVAPPHGTCSKPRIGANMTASGPAPCHEGCGKTWLHSLWFSPSF